jgi:hypothetical protein
LNLHELLDELVGLVARSEESERVLEQKENGLRHELQQLRDELSQRKRDISSMNGYRSFLERRVLDLLQDHEKAPVFFDPNLEEFLPLPVERPESKTYWKSIELAAERSKKILRSKENKRLLEDLPRYTRHLEADINRYEERRAFEARLVERLAKVRHEKQSLEPGGPIVKLKAELENCFDIARADVLSVLRPNQRDEFLAWCQRNGFVKDPRISVQGIASNWKRARISSSRFDSEMQPDAARKFKQGSDPWILESAFRAFLALSPKPKEGR